MVFQFPIHITTHFADFPISHMQQATLRNTNPLFCLGALWRSYQGPLCCEVSQAKEGQLGWGTWRFFQLLSFWLLVYEFLIRVGKRRQQCWASGFAFLPARPSFPVDVVAHAPKNLTSLAQLAQCYYSQALSPLSCLDDDVEMEDVYLNNYGLENGIRWPKLPAEDEGPADFMHLLDPLPVQQPVSPVSSVCPTTLMDEREGQSDMLEGLGQFLDDTDRALGEMISYCDTLVQMDPSPAEAWPFSIQFASTFLIGMCFSFFLRTFLRFVLFFSFHADAGPGKSWCYCAMFCISRRCNTPNGCSGRGGYNAGINKIWHVTSLLYRLVYNI